MRIPSKIRHSGMDSPQAILPDALRVAANLFPADLCRNPGGMDSSKRTVLALDARKIGAEDFLI